MGHRNSYIDSPIKQEHREILKGLLEIKKGNKKVLTMAGVVGKDAKMYASQNAIVFSVERDTDVYNKQMMELKHYPVLIWNMSMLNFINESLVEKIKFDLIYLDYCGPYTKQNEDTLKAIFKKGLLPRGGNLAVTVSLSRDGYSKILKGTDLLSLTCGGDINYYLENKVNSINATIKSMASGFGLSLKENHKIEYKNPGSKMDMLFLVYSLGA